MTYFEAFSASIPSIRYIDTSDHPGTYIYPLTSQDASPKTLNYSGLSFMVPESLYVNLNTEFVQISDQIKGSIISKITSSDSSSKTSQLISANLRFAGHYWNVSTDPNDTKSSIKILNRFEG